MSVRLKFQLSIPKTLYLIAIHFLITNTAVFGENIDLTSCAEFLRTNEEAKLGESAAAKGISAIQTAGSIALESEKSETSEKHLADAELLRQSAEKMESAAKDVEKAEQNYRKKKTDYETLEKNAINPMNREKYKTLKEQNSTRENVARQCKDKINSQANDMKNAEAKSRTQANNIKNGDGKGGQGGQPPGGGGGGGQGQGGGGEQGGGSALAGALVGAAAALGPAIAAAIQADAEKDVAKTNAEAQIAMTKMTSDTSKYLADNQKQIAEQQAAISKEMNDSKLANDALMDDKKIAALQDKSTKEVEVKREQMALTQQENQRLMAQKDATLKAQQDMKKLEFQNQLVAAGGTPGYTVARTGSTLNVTRTFNTKPGTPSSATMGTASNFPPSYAMHGETRAVASDKNELSLSATRAAGSGSVQLVSSSGSTTSLEALLASNGYRGMAGKSYDMGAPAVAKGSSKTNPQFIDPSKTALTTAELESRAIANDMQKVAAESAKEYSAKP